MEKRNRVDMRECENGEIDWIRLYNSHVFKPVRNTCKIHQEKISAFQYLLGGCRI
jgi:hypothetical protein